jgi:LCP family protein required for cell wall assembly
VEQPTSAEDIVMRDATYEPLVRRKRRRRTSWLRRVTRRPRHFVRRHKALSVIVAVALILLLILLLWLWFLNRKLDDVPRFDVDLGDDRPYVAEGTNILIAGVDDGRGTELKDALQAEEWPQGVFRSDAIMVVHISEDWSDAQVVSIPRDSYVPVEGHGRTKINAAFSFGGPSLLARTVEDVTDLHIDHVMVTDFEGFKGITTTLGGIMVHIPEESVDARSPLKPGWHLIEGDDALVYVRQRYGLARGDFDRVQRQQNVLRAIVDRSSRWSILANPLRVTSLVDDVATHLAVDSSLTSGKLRELGLNARNLRVHDVTFATAPNSGSATIDGASVVKLKPAAVRALFRAIGQDDFARYLAEHPVEVLPPAQEVK